MPFRTFDDSTTHLKELAELEKMFFNQFGVEEFYHTLLQFVNTNFDANTNQPPTPDELYTIDNFVKTFLQKRLSDSERWIVRGYVLGKLIEQAEKQPTKFLVDVKKLPTDIETAAANYHLNLHETQALHWAKLRGGENIKNIGQDASKIVRKNLMDTIQSGGGYGTFQKKMQAEVMEKSGDINRMWRRVAITEVNSAFNNGYLMQLQNQEYVMGMSAPDACENCKGMIDGKVYLYITQPPRGDYMLLNKNTREYAFAKYLHEKAVWTGKSNVGRSFSKFKRINPEEGNSKGNLIEREHWEIAMPTIPLHPHCRCRWLRIDTSYFYVDDSKRLKLKLENPQAWQKWYDGNIKSLQTTWNKYSPDKIKG